MEDFRPLTHPGDEATWHLQFFQVWGPSKPRPKRRGPARKIGSPKNTPKKIPFNFLPGDVPSVCPKKNPQRLQQNVPGAGVPKTQASTRRRHFSILGCRSPRGWPQVCLQQRVADEDLWNFFPFDSWNSGGALPPPLEGSLRQKSAFLCFIPGSGEPGCFSKTLGNFWGARNGGFGGMLNKFRASFVSSFRHCTDLRGHFPLSKNQSVTSQKPIPISHPPLGYFGHSAKKKCVKRNGFKDKILFRRVLRRVATFSHS